MLGWIVLAQAATGSGPVLELQPLLRAEPNCMPAQNDELVVCGRTDEPSPYRLPPLPPRFEGPLIPKAETNLLGGTAVIEGEQGRFDPRIMARIKWKS